MLWLLAPWVAVMVSAQSCTIGGGTREVMTIPCGGTGTVACNSCHNGGSCSYSCSSSCDVGTSCSYTCTEVKCGGSPGIGLGMTSSCAGATLTPCGSKCYISCDTCYSGATSEYECVKSGGIGVWSGTLPTCTRMTCPAFSVPGSMVNGCNSGSSTECGVSCEVSCAACYEVDSVYRSCTESSWSGGLPTCDTLKTCGAIPDGEGYLGVSSVTCGSTATMSCRACFSGSPKYMTCGSSGWNSYTPPTCTMITCGAIAATSEHSGCAAADCGRSCTIECTDVCYSGSSVTLTCTSTGWSNPSLRPTCTVTTCPALSISPGVMVSTCSGAQTCGTECDVSCTACYGGETVRRQCLPDSSWSSASPSSCVQVTCSAIAFDAASMTNGCAGSGVCGDSCTLTCNACHSTGSADSATRQCLSSGSWSGENPACPVRQCTRFSLGTTGQSDCADGLLDCGTTCTSECLPCYASSGDTTRTCQPDGTWDSSSPTCTIRTCPAVPATVSYSGCSSDTCGGTCTLSCTECYSGSVVTRSCGPSSWTPADVPSCSLRQCSPITLLTGQLSTCSSGTTHGCGTSCEITCEDCYITVGGDSPRTCQADTFWSGASPTCTLRVCAGIPLDPGQESTCSDGEQFCGTTCTVSCTSCYSPNAAVARTCQPNGTWSEASPTCSQRTCGAVLDTVEYTGTNTTKCGDSSTLACTPCYNGAPEARTCQPTGWSTTALPSCIRRTCPAIPLVAGMMNTCSSGTEDCGTICNITCDTCYTMGGGGASRQCLPDTTWTSESPSCTLRYCADPDASTYSGCGAASCGSTCTLACLPGLSGVPVGRQCLRDGWNTSHVPYCFGQGVAVTGVNNVSRAIVLTSTVATLSLSSSTVVLAAGVDQYAFVVHGSGCGSAVGVATGGSGSAATASLSALPSSVADYDLCYNFRGIEGMILQVTARPWIRIINPTMTISSLGYTSSVIEGTTSVIRAMGSLPLASTDVVLFASADKYEFVVSGVPCTNGSTAGSPCLAPGASTSPYVLAPGSTPAVRYDLCYNVGGYAGLTKQETATPWVNVIEASIIVDSLLGSTTTIVLSATIAAATTAATITSSAGSLLPGVDTYAFIPSGSTCSTGVPSLLGENNTVDISVLLDGHYDLCYNFRGASGFELQELIAPLLVVADTPAIVTSFDGLVGLAEYALAVSNRSTALPLFSATTFLSPEDMYTFVPTGSSCPASATHTVSVSGATMAVSIADLVPGRYDLCYALLGVDAPVKQTGAAPWLSIVDDALIVTTVDGWNTRYWGFERDIKGPAAMITSSTVELTANFDLYAFVRVGTPCPKGDFVGSFLALGDMVDTSGLVPGEYDLCYDFAGVSGLSRQAPSPWVTVLEDACPPLTAPAHGGISACLDAIVDPCAAWASTRDLSCGPSVASRVNCSFVCDVGFSLSTPVSLCERGEWVHIQTCLEDPCYLEEGHVTANGNAAPCDVVESGSNCTIECRAGYRITGSPRQCYLGNWLGVMQECFAVECPLLDTPGNGTLTCSELGNFYTPLDPSVGCAAACNVGFTREHGLEFLICRANGQWSGPLLSCTDACGGSCPALQQCVDNVCICAEGYVGSPSVGCDPVCTNCRRSEFRWCASPGICKCLPGYRVTGTDICEPICEVPCEVGLKACAAPNTCELLDSLTCGDKIFTAPLGEECDGPYYCTEECECDPVGWVYNSTRKYCVPQDSGRMRLLIRSAEVTAVVPWLATLLSMLSTFSVPHTLLNFTHTVATRRADFGNYEFVGEILASEDPYLSGLYLMSLLMNALYRGDERLSFDPDHSFGFLQEDNTVLAAFWPNGRAVLLGQCSVNLEPGHVPLRVASGDARGTVLLAQLEKTTRLKDALEIFNQIEFEVPAGSEAYVPVPRFWTMGNAKLVRLPVWQTNEKVEISLTHIGGGPVQVLVRMDRLPYANLLMDPSNMKLLPENTPGWDCSFSMKLTTEAADDAVRPPEYDHRLSAYVPPGSAANPTDSLTITFTGKSGWLYLLAIQSDGIHTGGYSNQEISDTGFALTNVSKLNYDVSSNFNILARYSDPTAAALNIAAFVPVVLLIAALVVVVLRFPSVLVWIKGQMWRPTGHRKTAYMVTVSAILERNRENAMKGLGVASEDDKGVMIRPLFHASLDALSHALDDYETYDDYDGEYTYAEEDEEDEEDSDGGEHVRSHARSESHARSADGRVRASTTSGHDPVTAPHHGGHDGSDYTEYRVSSSHGGHDASDYTDYRASSELSSLYELQEEEEVSRGGATAGQAAPPEARPEKKKARARASVSDVLDCLAESARALEEEGILGVLEAHDIDPDMLPSGDDGRDDAITLAHILKCKEATVQIPELSKSFTSFVANTSAPSEEWIHLRRRLEHRNIEASIPMGRESFASAKAAILRLRYTYEETASVLDNLLLYMTTRITAVENSPGVAIELELVVLTVAYAAGAFFNAIHEPMTNTRSHLSDLLREHLFTEREAELLLLDFFRVTQKMIGMLHNLTKSIYCGLLDARTQLEVMDDAAPVPFEDVLVGEASTVTAKEAGDAERPEGRATANAMRTPAAVDDTKIRKAAGRLTEVQREHVTHYLEDLLNRPARGTDFSPQTITALYSSLGVGRRGRARKFLYSIMSQEQLDKLNKGEQEEGNEFDSLWKVSAARQAVTSVVTNSLAMLAHSFGASDSSEYVQELSRIGGLVQKHVISSAGPLVYISKEVRRLDAYLVELHVPELHASLSFLTRQLSEHGSATLTKLLAAESRLRVENRFERLLPNLAELLEDDVDHAAAIDVLTEATTLAAEFLEATVFTSAPAMHLPAVVAEISQSNGLPNDPGRAIRAVELAHQALQYRAIASDYHDECNRFYKELSSFMKEHGLNTRLKLKYPLTLQDALTRACVVLRARVKAAKREVNMRIPAPDRIVDAGRSLTMTPICGFTPASVFASLSEVLSDFTDVDFHPRAAVDTHHALHAARALDVANVVLFDVELEEAQPVRESAASKMKKVMLVIGVLCGTLFSSAVSIMKAFLDARFLHYTTSQSVEGFTTAVPWPRIELQFTLSWLGDLGLGPVFSWCSGFLETIFSALQEVASFFYTSSFNCGGVVFALAPIFFTLVCAATFLLVKKDFLVKVGIGLRNKTVLLGYWRGAVAQQLVDLLTAALVYFLQLSIHSAGLVLSSGLLNFQRTCDDVDRVFAIYIGRPFAAITLGLMYLFNYFLFASPPPDRPSWSFIDRRQHPSGRLPLLAYPFLVMWLVLDAAKRHFLGVFGFWTKNMIWAHRIHYLAGTNDADREDDNNLEEDVLVLVGRSCGLFWLFFPLGSWLTKFSEALTSFPIFVVSSTPGNSLSGCISKAQNKDDIKTSDNVQTDPNKEWSDAADASAWEAQETADYSSWSYDGSDMLHADPATFGVRSAPGSEVEYNPQGLTMYTPLNSRLSLWALSLLKFAIIVCIVLGIHQHFFTIFGFIMIVEFFFHLVTRIQRLDL